MNCPQPVTYTIRKGDNLYQLARFYQTTVPRILSLNPNLDPYRLQIGSTITICPGEGFIMPPGTIAPPVCPDASRHVELLNDMRMAWSQHVYWVRMLLISLTERLRDQNDVAARLMRNPGDISRLFALFYAADTAHAIERLITEHLRIGIALITALRDGNSQEAERLNRLWYVNADEIADTLRNANPFYDRDELREMLYSHLRMTSQEVAMRLAGNYQAEIEAFDTVEREILAMADYLSMGLIRQFPQKF